MFMEFLTSVTRFIHRAMEEREWVWLSSHVPSAGVLHLQKKDQEQIGPLPKPVSNVQVSTVRRQDPHLFSLFCSLRKSLLSIFPTRAMSSVYHLFFIPVQHNALQALSLLTAPCRQDFSHQKSLVASSSGGLFLLLPTNSLEQPQAHSSPAVVS